MRYFEEAKVFSYKVKDEKTGNMKWRISVDMGLHEYLMVVVSECSKYATIPAIAFDCKSRLITLIKEAQRLVTDRSGMQSIMDNVYLEHMDEYNKAAMQIFNEVDAQTLYNIKYWEAILAAIEGMEEIKL